MTKNEKLTIWILSIAVFISLMVFGYTIWKDIESAKEQLSLVIAEFRGDYETKINTESHVTIADDTRAGIGTAWVVTLSNNGSITTSILNYSIWAESNKSEYGIYYSPELIQLSEMNGSPLPTPFTIVPGHSKRFLIKFDYPVKEDLFKVIESNYPVDEKLNMGEIQYQLRTVEGFDIWGNKVNTFFIADSLYQVLDANTKYNSDNEVYAFKLTLTTSKGHIFRLFEPYIGQPLPNDEGHHHSMLELLKIP